MNRHSSRSHAVCRIFVEMEVTSTNEQLPNDMDGSGGNGGAKLGDAASLDIVKFRDETTKKISAQITRAAKANGRAQVCE